MRGKLAEDTKTVVMHRAKQMVATTVCYGDIVDTRDYDEAKIVLNVGTALGPTTLGAILYESDVKTVDSMVRVTGGLFPLVSSTNDDTVYVGSIKTKNYRRYLTLQLTAGAPGSPTIPMSATAILGRGDTVPSDDSLAFDLGD